MPTSPHVQISCVDFFHGERVEKSNPLPGLGTDSFSLTFHAIWK